MTRDTLGSITFLFLLAITFAATYGIISRIGQPKTQREEKFENADLVRYYVVERESGPTFELRKSDRTIKLITHAELPRYERNARILYGFHVTIQDPSGVAYWETDFYTRTRQSKDRLEQGAYRDENTFNATGDTEYGDDRLLELRLPDDIRDGSQLKIRLAGPTPDGDPVERVLLRAYRKTRRSTVDRQIRIISMTRADKRRMADRVGLPWDLIPTDQRDALITYRWDRMAALGEEGADYATRLVFYSGFRTRPEEDEDKLGIHVHALHAAALNVLVAQPSTFTLVAKRYVPGTVPRCAGESEFLPDMDGNVEEAPEEEEVALDVDFVSDDTLEGIRELVPPGPGGIERSLTVPGGLYSLQFRTESPAGVVFCLRAARAEEAQFGYIRPIPIDADTEELIVDVRRIPAYYSDSREEQEPISTYIDGPSDIESRTFAIEVRTLMPSRVWTEPSPRLHYRFLDDKGHIAAGGYTELHPELAPFEKARMSTSTRRDDEDDEGEMSGEPEPERPELEGPREAPVDNTPQQSVITEEDSFVPISEPMRFPLIAPTDARHLLVWTDRPSLLRVLANLGERDQYEAPYCEYEPDNETIGWRYAPRERRRWFPTRPENRELLADSSRIARIRVQVRLEPRDPTLYARTERVAVLLEPVRPPERQLILEPVAADKVADAVREWPAGGYTKLLPKTRIAVSGKINQRPKLRYFLDDSRADLLGLFVDVEVHDGKSEPIRITHQLSTPRGVWTLPYLPKGEYSFQCAPSRDRPPPTRALAEALRNHIDCYLSLPPSAGEQRIMRARTVYPLDHRPLRLVVEKKPGRDVVIRAVVYDVRSDGRSDPYIYARIDNGQPRRTVGTVVSSITRAEHSWSLPPARSTGRPMFVDLAGRSPGFPRVISMRLGGDLAVGKHTIDIKAPPLSGWVRFYTYDLDPREQESAWQWQFEAPNTSTREDSE